MNINLNDLLEKIFSGSVLASLGFCIRYAGNMVKEIRALNTQIHELTYQIKSMGERQNHINTNLADKCDALKVSIEGINTRLITLEKGNRI